MKCLEEFCRWEEIETSGDKDTDKKEEDIIQESEHDSASEQEAVESRTDSH